MRHYISAVFLFVGIMVSGSASAQKASDQKAKTDMLKAFYTEYITANAKEPVDAKQVQAILKKYLTTKFLKEYATLSGELDYDLFVSAQEFDIEWLKTLTIEPAATFNIFRVTYDMGFEDDKALIRPIVAKEGKTFKIDGVKTD
ncbi:DUF3828 domain-containing protein [Flavobacterium selenitireducens]|uniref:DUF3828 domain-containing protein n=1 Tax=Flavobacterium selenitireducens TaxID=2722704 RepID=UPI00168AA63A|nr:DUF3828 domain-containing protein [Flavobacterium selenitireducens]MBD3581820.1 DUF3828 domain-containing protein [Flavobacterium selenitireducens]